MYLIKEKNQLMTLILTLFSVCHIKIKKKIKRKENVSNDVQSMKSRSHYTFKIKITLNNISPLCIYIYGLEQFCLEVLENVFFLTQ